MNEVDKLARVLLDYMRMDMPLRKSDAIVGMGALDVRVAEWAVELLIDGYGKYLIFTGGHGRVSKHVQKQTEAERFCEVALAIGIPPSKIYLDKRGSNTTENVLNVAQLVKTEKLRPRSLLVVTKPSMERRVYEAYRDLWPGEDTQISVTSAPLTYDEQPDENISKELFLNLLVGDVQRILQHPRYRLRSIPDEVRDAYERMIFKGYTQQLVPEQELSAYKKTLVV